MRVSASDASRQLGGLFFLMPVMPTTDVLICGAGIAGIATAHALAVRHGMRNVMLVDERAPLSLTSDKSTEAYRNWWPGPDDAMVRFMNRSIDLLEQWAEASGNRFHLNRRGYYYATADLDRAAQFERDAQRSASQGAGVTRIWRSATAAAQYQPSAHRGFAAHPTGADLFVGREAIRARFPWLSGELVAVLHARRCGWMSGQQLGMYLLEEARAAGVTVVSGRVERVDTSGGRVNAVDLALADGTTTRVATPTFVNAAGPFARDVGRLVGVELPLFSELHLKVAFEDTLGAVDRDTGLVILEDPQTLDWDDEVRADLASRDETRALTTLMPAGVHLRPEGYGPSQTVLMLWDYHGAQRYDAPRLPLPDDALYPEVVMRGMVRLVPALAPYLDRLPAMAVDGGYYTKTAENRSLVGPLPVVGAFVNAAHSGFGLMAAPAAGELLAAHVTGSALPSYAPAFALARYDDAAYRTRMAAWGSTGQL